MDTSLAFGNGLSVATGIPEVEKLRKDERSKALLSYLMLELSFALPALPQWSLFFRIHHRSGVFGFFNGAWGGSNYLCLGIRWITI